MVALGLGADGICPYAMVEVACVDDYRTRRRTTSAPRCARASRRSSPRSASTRCAATRACSRRIGLRPELAAIFDTPAYFGSERRRHRLRGAGRATAMSGCGSLPDRGVQAGRDLPLLPEGLEGGDRCGERARRLYADYSAKVRELEAAAADLPATHPRPERRTASRSDRSGGRRGWPPLLPDRDLVDELRLAGRDRLSAPTPRPPSGSTSWR